MNENELLELTYRNPNKVKMTTQERINILEKLKLEVLSKNPVGLMIAIPEYKSNRLVGG